MIKMLKKIFCRHSYRVISPEVCFGQGKIGYVCECSKCGHILTI